MAMYLVLFENEKRLSIVPKELIIESPVDPSQVKVKWGEKFFNGVAIEKSDERRVLKEKMDSLEKTLFSKAVVREGKRTVKPPQRFWEQESTLDDSINTTLDFDEGDPDDDDADLVAPRKLGNMSAVATATTTASDVVGLLEAESDVRLGEAGAAGQATESDKNEMTKHECCCCAKMKRLERVVDMLSVEVRKLRKRTLVTSGMTAKEVPVAGASSSEQVVYGDIVLTQLPGSTPAKFGISVARKLFSPEEIEDKCISPKKKTKRSQMPQEKVEIMKAAVKSRFGEGIAPWTEAKAAANQIGLDAKRKRSRNASEAV